MSKLSSSQERELREAFEIFDKDGSNSISSKELRDVFRALEINASESQVQAAMKQMDRNGDGEISFSEFKRVMEVQFYRKYTNDEIRCIFDHFDRDNSGFITADELREALSKIGKTFRNEEIERMIKAIDKDNDGRISINEFVELLK
ncbi:calmodulin [Brachionus plicatilis]|uniref:Calmodulin n=1 Tax=Brachionus plicatilis TaxID=10195 RepID=A0A3M7R8Y4_BRAPC|nr:calmodulin [Brachionus plicatilis]